MRHEPQEDPTGDGCRSKTDECSTSRRAYLTAAGSATIAATAGCLGDTVGGGSGKPDFIRYLGWGGNTQNSAKQLFKKWSDKTGIKVKHQSAGGDAAILSTIKQNPGKIDIANMTSYGIALARQEDLLAKVTYDNLPNYMENMEKEFRHAPYVNPEKESDTVFRDPLTQGFTVNTKKVSSNPTAWSDLLDINAKISLRDDPLSRFSNAALDTGSNINKMLQSESVFQKAVEHQKKLNSKVLKYWGSGAQAIRLLRDKNVSIAEMWGGRTLALKDAGYDQMEYTIPDEGSYVLDENYIIPDSSKKQETVHDLINWSYQRQNCIELSKNLGYPIMMNDPPKAITSLPDYAKSIDRYSWPNYPIEENELSKMQRTFQQIKQS